MPAEPESNTPAKIFKAARLLPIVLAVLCPEAGVAAPPVSVGLFRLFRSAVVEVETRRPLLIGIHDGTVHARKVLVEGQKLQVRLNAGKLATSLVESDEQLELWTRKESVTIEGGRFTLVIPGKIRRDFCGRLQVHASHDQLLFRLTLDEEVAVQQILRSEMAEAFELDALKAQAILIRSYLRTSRGRHSEEGYDYCDTTHCQFLAAFIDEQDPFQAAVASTTGWILTFQGKPFRPPYTAACGGQTLDRNHVSHSIYPHQSVRCIYCAGHPLFDWERTLERSKLFRALSEIRGAETKDMLAALATSEGTRSAELLKRRARRSVGRLYGWNIIPSESYSVDSSTDPAHIRGHGSGHNRGLCQAGAIKLARRKRSFLEIIELYFPGAEVR